MLKKTAIYPTLAILLACSVKSPGDTDSELTANPSSTGTTDSAVSGSTTTDDTGTTAPSPGTTTDHGEVVTDTGPGDTTEAQPDLGGGQACDIWQEDCPAGQKCMPVSLDGDSVWEQSSCVPVVPDPAGLNEPCELLGDGLDGLDTCDEHTMCWEVDPATNTRVCLGLCTGTPDDPSCADPDAACQLSAESVLNLCLPTCDPLASDCPSGQVCIPDGSAEQFVCAPDLSGEGGQAFDPCSFVNQCDPGHVCVDAANASQCDPQQGGCCLPFCDVTGALACPSPDLECTPWFEDSGTAPDLDHVGVCVSKP